MSNSRQHMLEEIRRALGRAPGDPIAPPPPPRLRTSETPTEERIAQMTAALERLAAKPFRAHSLEDARQYVRSVLQTRRAAALYHPFLEACGILALDGVEQAPADPVARRQLFASVEIGITCPDYALADTGTLVALAGAYESRLASLLPPVHLAILQTERILSGLDELLVVLPHPADITSALLLITGPSRTADIEQILVRGVHGPGEVHVIMV